MIRKTELPDELNIKGVKFLPVIGGHLEHEPFLTVEHSGVDVTQNGWGNALFESQERELIRREAKGRGLKHRTVAVLSRNLRGKLDLHGKPYRPNIYVFVEVRDDENNA